jgi:glycosyltransferase involved in cell wall biosynthesis
VRTVWVPSWRSPCGIAEYTAHLTETLPVTRVEAQLGDMRGVRLLHVQHEGSLFQDVDLTRCVLEARLSGIPVAVTEHAVGPRRLTWEGEANVLLALTPRGAEALRARWPHSRVEYMPHGCPTWFPASKRRRGRVIGAFGFLEPHKGFWRVLEALRALPQAELLMFSYAKRRETERSWEEAASGLPVRRIREFTSSAEVAHRLAAEADVLVFWYDETAVAAASGAVRVGLATGVPVLTSPTGWFQDVREATYQPEDLVEGIKRLLEDTPLRERVTAAAQEYCHAHSWSRVAERHLALWQAMEAA